MSDFQHVADRFRTACMQILEDAEANGDPHATIEQFGRLSYAIGELIVALTAELQTCANAMREAETDQRNLADVMRQAARDLHIGG